MNQMYDSIIVGAGFAGSVLARELAERGKERVLIIEKRNHPAGNCYDLEDSYGILVHQYGPHIFHTNSDRVYEYLSRFTEWYDYSHEVAANVNGQLIPVPFNLNTLYMVYGREMAMQLEKKLVDAFGRGSRVPILKLMEQEDEELKAVAEYVYQNIFLRYTMKQWGQKPEEISPEVTGRVPVLISNDNRYFQDTYQGMPLKGYTNMVQEMLSYPGIDLELGLDAKSVLKPENGTLYYKGEPYKGKVIYTGPIDEFFDCRYGRLPYRSLRFEFKHFNQDSYQEKAVVNYTVSEDFTRITEFKKLTGQEMPGSTTIMREYPIAYTDSEKEIPYYAIMNEENMELYRKYQNLLKDYPGFYLLGRLAEYKYYNIDAIVEKALFLADELIYANGR